MRSVAAASADEAGGDDAEDAAGEGVGEVLVDRAAGEGAEHQREAVEDGAGGDGGDDGLEAAVDDDEAVERAAGEAGGEDGEDAEAGLEGGADDEPGGEAVGQRQHHADGEVDAGGGHDQRLGHGDEGEERGLVGGGLHHVGGEAGGVVGDVDEEHDHEDADGHQRAALLGQPVAPVLHAILGREGGGAVKGMGTLGFSGLESGWKVAGMRLATF